MRKTQAYLIECGKMMSKRKNKLEIVEFEVDKTRLIGLLSSYVGRGIFQGDNWWIPTTDKKVIKLIVKEKPVTKKMSKAEEKLRRQISMEIEDRLRWDNSPLQIRSAVNKMVNMASDIAKGAV